MADEETFPENTEEENTEPEPDEFEDLKKQIEALRIENEELNEQIATSPYATDGNYQREFERLTRKADNAESELKQLKSRLRDEALEREKDEEDRIEADKRRLEEIGAKYGEIQQDYHTRFRVMEKPPTGQRDIFGDPTIPVVDMGVDFTNYAGGIYIPVYIFIEVGQSIGMLTKEQSEDLTGKLDLATAKNESAGRFAEELVSGITTCVDNFYSSLSNVVLTDVSDDSNAEESNGESGESSGQTHDANVGEESAGVPDSTNDPESEPEPPKESTSIFGKL